MRGATKRQSNNDAWRKYFNSRTSCEVRPSRVITGRTKFSDFNSRTSCEVRLYIISNQPRRQISTHAPHARCDFVEISLRSLYRISTHAPHARCDKLLNRYMLETVISTHAPHARCDEHTSTANCYQDISTHAPHAMCDICIFL